MLKTKDGSEITLSQALAFLECKGITPPKLEHYYCPHYSVNAAVTRRWTSAFHGIPANSDVKACLVPRHKDGFFLHADFSQNEYRVFAALAKEGAIMQAFREGKDIHRFIASRIFGKLESEVTNAERNVAKRCVLGSTLIETELGLIKIEDLVRTNYRGLVRSFSTARQQFEWKPMVYGEMTVETGNYVELVLEDDDGNEYTVTCTPDHEFLLDDGITWVEAQHLVNGSVIK